MWWMLIAIIGCYAFAALIVRAAARRYPGWSSRTHVVLFACNQEGRIEWYLRRLRRWSLRTGRDVRVTLVDCGSTDDTSAIAERFGRRSGAVSVVHANGMADGGSPGLSGVPGSSGNPAALKETWRLRLLSGTAMAEAVCGDERDGVDAVGRRFGGDGEARDGDGEARRGVGDEHGVTRRGLGNACCAEDLLLIDLGDPEDVAMLP